MSNLWVRINDLAQHFSPLEKPLCAQSGYFFSFIDIFNFFEFFLIFFTFFGFLIFFFFQFFLIFINFFHISMLHIFIITFFTHIAHFFFNLPTFFEVIPYIFSFLFFWELLTFFIFFAGCPIQLFYFLNSSSLVLFFLLSSLSPSFNQVPIIHLLFLLLFSFFSSFSCCFWHTPISPSSPDVDSLLGQPLLSPFPMTLHFSNHCHHAFLLPTYLSPSSSQVNFILTVCSSEGPPSIRDFSTSSLSSIISFISITAKTHI